MGKNKKKTKAEKRQQRLQKAKQWLTTYMGSPKHIVRGYRKKFSVDTNCAVCELQLLGCEFTQEYLDALKRNEELRLKQRAAEKQKKLEQEFDDRYPDSDDRFFFIAGYTSGGAPYGTTWEEMGMEPYGSFPNEFDTDDELF